MRLPRPKGEPQRLAGAKEVRLAYDFIKVARAKLLGERGQGLPFCEEIIH
jgi:hypothetical protein